jgi:hypothetical protein
MVMIGVDPRALIDLKRISMMLPAIMCIGDFVSCRPRADGTVSPVALYVVWLQDTFLPYLSEENEAAFKAVNWNDFGPKRVEVRTFSLRYGWKGLRGAAGQRP